MHNRKPIIGKCNGCDKVTPIYLVSCCKTYADPARRWAFMGGPCPVATHLKKVETKKQKVRVGQQKQRKGW